MKTKAKKRSARVNASDRRTVARMTQIKRLLAYFGLELHGYTGNGMPERLTAYIIKEPRAGFFVGQEGGGYWGEPIAFNMYEWRWLEPLLIELKKKRGEQPMRITWKDRADGASAFVDGKPALIGYQRIRRADGLESQIYKNGARLHRINGGDRAARQWVENYLKENA